MGYVESESEYSRYGPGYLLVGEKNVITIGVVKWYPPEIFNILTKISSRAFCKNVLQSYGTIHCNDCGKSLIRIAMQ